MSPLCQLEMTLPEGFAGGVWGDGSTDERWEADAARSAAGSGSETIDDCGCGAAAGARAAPGVPTVKGYRTEGPTGLISKRRGRPSNRRKPEALRRSTLAMIREWYWDFGPTLAAEKLREVHGIPLGRETLRLWMVESGPWLDRKQRQKRVHQRS